MKFFNNFYTRIFNGTYTACQQTMASCEREKSVLDGIMKEKFIRYKIKTVFITI